MGFLIKFFVFFSVSTLQCAEMGVKTTISARQLNKSRSEARSWWLTIETSSNEPMTLCLIFQLLQWVRQQKYWYRSLSLMTSHKFDPLVKAKLAILLDFWINWMNEWKVYCNIQAHWACLIASMLGFDILSNTCHPASCCLNSKKLFTIVYDRYCNPDRGFKPGTEASVSTWVWNMATWQLRPLAMESCAPGLTSWNFLFFFSFIDYIL